MAATMATMPDVVNWVAPPARKVPARMHAEALICAFQAQGRTGAQVHVALTRRYPELCWALGFVQMTDRQLLQALSQLCTKVRRDADILDKRTGTITTMLRAIHYVIPEPQWAAELVQAPDKIVAFRRGANPRIAAQKQIQGSKRNSASLPKSGWPGRGAYRADIGQAVANG